MTRPATIRIAAIAALAAALALSGCGRKGPLDLPPSAAAPPQTSATPPSGEATQQSLFSPLGEPTETHPPPPTGRKRKLPIDALID